MTKQAKSPQAVRRNFAAKNQWQRGGVHEKTHKSKRKQEKQQLQRKLRADKISTDFFMSAICAF